MWLKNIGIVQQRISTPSGEFVIKPGQWIDVPVTMSRNRMLIEVDADGNAKSTIVKTFVTEENKRSLDTVIEPVAPLPSMDTVSVQEAPAETLQVSEPEPEPEIKRRKTRGINSTSSVFGSTPDINKQ